MENKINIAELLKDCPKGMELDCTMYDGVEFMEVDTESDTIILRVGNKFIRRLNKYGQDDNVDCAKCVIFPKGKTTWEGFVPPYQFKDGDVVVDDSGAIFFYRQIHPYYEEPYADFYCGVTSEIRGFVIKTGETQRCGKISSIRYATEEEKQILFDAIKARGYRWNAETKTLEKLPKFKVGDTIRHKTNKEVYCKLDKYSEGISAYRTNIGGLSLTYKDLEQWELVPNKFDINILKPYDKVLVRDNNTQEWVISFFSHCNGLEKYKYSCVNGSGYAQCVPYEENKHLRGTTNDCDDFYKTWE